MANKVYFFRTRRGSCPVKEFIEKQDRKSYTKIIRYIELLEEYGSYLKPPYIKKLQDKLFELRITGTTSIRIIYTVMNNGYYLLHGFIKKSQKTPSRELKTALDRSREII